MTARLGMVIGAPAAQPRSGAKGAVMRAFRGRRLSRKRGSNNNNNNNENKPSSSAEGRSALARCEAGVGGAGAVGGGIGQRRVPPAAPLVAAFTDDVGPAPRRDRPWRTSGASKQQQQQQQVQQQQQQQQQLQLQPVEERVQALSRGSVRGQRLAALTGSLPSINVAGSPPQHHRGSPETSRTELGLGAPVGGMETGVSDLSLDFIELSDVLENTHLGVPGGRGTSSRSGSSSTLTTMSMGSLRSASSSVDVQTTAAPPGILKRRRR